MNNNLIFFDEPNMAFGYDQSSQDPRDGLSLFGPFEKFTSHNIQVGVVATQEGIEHYSQLNFG